MDFTTARSSSRSDKQIVSSSRSKRVPFSLFGIKWAVSLSFIILLALSNISIQINEDHAFSPPDTQPDNKVINEPPHHDSSMSTHTSNQLLEDKHERPKNSFKHEKDNNEDQRIGGIAWLMSFPNSGTTYTLQLLSKVTGTYAATNYGKEGDPTKSVAVFNGHPVPSWIEWIDSSWIDSKDVAMKWPTKGYLLTKTHCGGYCFDCFVGDKFQLADTKNPPAFLKACSRGKYVSQDATSGQLNILTAYTPKEKIVRAVHVIRDPFDNVVSRFHDYRHQMIKKEGSESWLAKYPNTRVGFRDYCNNVLGEKWRVKEQEFMPFKEISDLIKDVPCHSDFFRYIQWHNLAFESTKKEHIPTMTIHYENYTDNFNKTKDELLHFLEQDEVNEPPLFITGKTYRDYYTEEEIVAVSKMFSKLAQQDTWKNTKHYFKPANEGPKSSHEEENEKRDEDTSPVNKRPHMYHAAAPDFGIIGYPKTGTTFLQNTLRRHPEVSMPPKEVCGVEFEMMIKNISQSHSSTKRNSTRYGFKCPTMIRDTKPIEKLVKISKNATRLVVGVRHPVLWFESFYNYRVKQYHMIGAGKPAPIPSPLELTNNTHWQSVSVKYARFDIYLKQLAKVSLTDEEMNEVFDHETMYPKRMSPNPYKIFLYTLEQMSAHNNTRRMEFQNDFQAFLQLHSPLNWRENEGKEDSLRKNFKESINICDEKYSNIRSQLTRQGEQASKWIMDKFIESPDVFVSNVGFFKSALREWASDPCDKRKKKLAVA